ncbi:hypothetical protein E0H59_17140 [Rhizobium leguminosarum bv. viciae]|nr:hypothetical protein E0H59_17140 [Rhizobium leguminosarum bv. viciae]
MISRRSAPCDGRAALSDWARRSIINRHWLHERQWHPEFAEWLALLDNTHCWTKRMTHLVVILTMAIFCLVGPTHAQDAASAFDFFGRHCLMDGPNFIRTGTIAQARGWFPLSADFLMTLAPMENPEVIEGWLVGERQQRTVVAVTRATIGGKAVEACTVAMSGIDSVGFERSFFQRIDAEVVQEERGPRHVHKLYSLIFRGRRELVTLIVPAEPAERSYVVGSVIAETQQEN